MVQYRPPLDIPILLAGSFGELRNNHFHAGIDIKTDNRENLPIYAVAEGYVSRIKIQPRGYGKSLYIDHPDGHTSVYAHINSVEGEIGEYLKRRQYELRSFEIDEKIPAGLLPVRQGQVVAKSGNTGSSTAPHLHFEIRDTQTEAALNPLLFGFYVNDNIKPRIDQAAIYPLKTDNIYDNPRVLGVKVLGGGAYGLVEGQLVMASRPHVGIGIKAFDKMNGADNLNGIYSLHTYNNGQLIYSFTLNNIPFEDTRCLNSHIDYKAHRENRGFMQKCFVDPGNTLPIYQNIYNRGIIDLSDGQPHEIRCEVRDVAGNQSTLVFMLQYKGNPAAANTPLSNFTQMLNYNNTNFFENDQVSIYFPQGIFYTDIPFLYSTRGATAQEKNVFSKIQRIHNDRTPVDDYFDIAIKPSAALPTTLYDKAVVVCTNTSHTIACGGTWEGSKLKGRAREFGDFYVSIDKTPPTIKGVNIFNGKNMAASKSIVLGISDNLSGIKSYNCYIDGQWILFEYDQKTTRLEHIFDGRIGRGNHNLRVEVSDERSNTQTYNAKFIR